MYIKVIDPKSVEQFKTQTQKGYWVILYYADWCPHCTSMKPEWLKFANKYQSNPNINVADVESSFIGNLGEQHQENAKNGFPSIVSCMKGRKINDFTGQRTSDAFDSFASSTYKENKPSTNINKLLRNNIKRSLAKTLKKLKMKNKMGTMQMQMPMQMQMQMPKVGKVKVAKVIKTPTPMLMMGGKKTVKKTAKKTKKSKKIQMGGAGPTAEEQSAFDKIVASLTFQPITKQKIEYTLAESLTTMGNKSYFIYLDDTPRTLETIVNGQKEVGNIVSKGDVVICGTEGEKIVISGDKFAKLYRIENNVAFPEQTPKNVAQYTGNGQLFFAPYWNKDERMVLNSNDYIIKEDEGKYYSIQKSIFESVYNELPGAKKTGFFGLF
jgi:thiol-disulfide isomerase/thioredoxin